MIADMPSAETRTTFPAAPRTLSETGVPWDVVYQMVCKTLHVAGEMTGLDLATRMGVVFSVIEPCLDAMKRDRLCEISGGSVGTQSYTYRLTEAGHVRADLFTEHNRYVGRLPVPLPQYSEYMRAFAQTARIRVTRESLKQAFDQLVVSDELIDQLGPAVAARHSLFIYGPPGNGKTVISKAIGQLLYGDLAVPAAVSVDTEIIRVFDPLNHHAVPEGPPGRKLTLDISEDRRWIRCRRPVISVGGELTLDALELGYSSTGGFYRAPLQMLANGGVLAIDDFGRQRISPQELLNRWIVPLESRADYLMLQSGQKIEVPFDVLITLATNMNPVDLVDEAFLRRLRYKIYAAGPTEEEFKEIFALNCRMRNLRYDPAVAQALIDTQLRPRNVELRGCQPRDLIEHALSLADYSAQPRELTAELLAAACATYFIHRAV